MFKKQQLLDVSIITHNIATYYPYASRNLHTKFYLNTNNSIVIIGSARHYQITPTALKQTHTKTLLILFPLIVTVNCYHYRSISITQHYFVHAFMPAVQTSVPGKKVLSQTCEKNTMYKTVTLTVTQSCTHSTMLLLLPYYL